MKLWLIAAFIFGTVVAVAMLLPALRRKGQAAGEQRLAQNAAAYRGRVEELDADLAADRIDTATYQALEQEAAAMLVSADEDVKAEQAGGRAPIIAAMVAVPVLTVALYLAGGGLPPMGAAETTDALLGQLEERLAQNPDDVESWFVLGRSRMVTGEYAKAAEAFREANARTGERAPELLVAEGEALAFARNDDLLGKPAQLFAKALESAPNHPRALWYSAQAALQAGQPREAIGFLQRLQSQNLPPALAEAVTSQLAELGAAPAPAEAEIAAAEPEGAVSIPVRVTLAEDLDAPQGATLYVFARIPEGPPMPLAVRRLGQASLPADVVLRESDAMMPNMSLANTETWLITARLSASGGAIAQPGDAQGQKIVTGEDFSASQPVQIVIDEIVQ